MLFRLIPGIEFGSIFKLWHMYLKFVLLLYKLVQQYKI